MSFLFGFLLSLFGSQEIGGNEKERKGKRIGNFATPISILSII